MTATGRVRDEPQKKAEIQELCKAIEKMDDTGRNFIAGAIAFAGILSGKQGDEDSTPGVNRPA